MSHASTISASIRDLVFAVVAIFAVATASVIGQLATYPNLAPWYAGLVKPSFNPPNWVFAPVWTMLYVLMAIALWRILRLPEVFAARRLALTLFFVQLALNAAWSWMFFGAHNPLLGAVNIIPQLFVILASVVTFHWLDRIAAFSMVGNALLYEASKSEVMRLFWRSCRLELPQKSR